jgi:F-box/leucine-rich repeat protein 6
MAIADQCHELRQLSVSSVESYFTAASLEAIAKNLCQLESLGLQFLTGGVNSKSIVNVIQLKGPQFRGLSVAGCQKVGRTLVQSIAGCCPNLMHLDLSCTPLRTLDVKAMQRGCPRLRALHLDHLTFCSYSYEDIEGEPHGFKELHILTLADSTLSPAVRTVEQLLSKSLKLHTLDLRAWSDPTYNSLVRALPTGCPNIQQLLVARWRYVNVPGFMQAISIYTHLRELDLSYCPGIDDDAATLLARTPVALSLMSLNLSSTQITASGLQTIVAACPHLESIDLTGCRGAPRGLKQKHNKEQIQQIRLRFGLI